jgi:hypothetical protein
MGIDVMVDPVPLKNGAVIPLEHHGLVLWHHQLKKR